MLLQSRLVDKSAKLSLEKSQVHYNCIKSEHLLKKTFLSGEQIRDKKYSTKFGKTLHIALCIVVKHK